MFVFLGVFTNEDISKYYDVSETHYRRIWDLDRSHSLHYGYWDSSVKNFREALLNINKVLADHAGIGPGENVLDAGCGVGGSAMWLARERDCLVTGISLNEKQVARATANASIAGLSDQLKFERKDYLDTGYASQSFDVIWGIESVCYANDKAQFAKEAQRLLKPGGRLIIADFFKSDGLGAREADQVRKWANGWAINDFSTAPEFTLRLRENNFEHVAMIDVTEAIMPSAKKLYRSFFPGIVGAKLYALIKPGASSLGKNNVFNAYLQYKTLRRGLWSYRIVKARKPFT